MVVENGGVTETDYLEARGPGNGSARVPTQLIIQLLPTCRYVHGIGRWVDTYLGSLSTKMRS